MDDESLDVPAELLECLRIESEATGKSLGAVYHDELVARRRLDRMMPPLEQLIEGHNEEPDFLADMEAS